MPHSVLIVEDDALVAFATELALSDFGFDVVGTAASGSAAVEMFERRHPDVVLMDVNLKGGMDGCETAAALSKYGAAVVFVTGQADVATRNRMMQTRPAGYLVKPYSPERLRQAIEAALPH